MSVVQRLISLEQGSIPTIQKRAAPQARRVSFNQMQPPLLPHQTFSVSFHLPPSSAVEIRGVVRDGTSSSQDPRAPSTLHLPTASGPTWATISHADNSAFDVSALRSTPPCPCAPPSTLLASSSTHSHLPMLRKGRWCFLIPSRSISFAKSGACATSLIPPLAEIDEVTRNHQLQCPSPPPRSACPAPLTSFRVSMSLASPWYGHDDAVVSTDLKHP